MSNETEIGAQALDSSWDTVDLRLRQELDMDSQENESSISEFKLRSVDERINLATDPILSGE